MYDASSVDFTKKIPYNSCKESYYASRQWMTDFEDDAQGKLPPDLKRGVLSEDAVYNLLADNDWLMERIRRIAECAGKKRG